jgi:hypothetical protein
MRTLIAFVVLMSFARSAAALPGDCGQPLSGSGRPTASDALFILRTSVGALTCTVDTCDVNSDCQVSATDALMTLRASVGGSVALDCACGATTTSTSLTTTTTLAPDDDSDDDGLEDSDDPCPIDPRNLCYGPVAVDSLANLPIRVNCNSWAEVECAGDRVDCNGDLWASDFGYVPPSASEVCDLPGDCAIAGIEGLFGCTSEETEDLFQCGRFVDTAEQPPLAYRFEVSNGAYLVNLYFANTFSGTDQVGERVFDIVIEGAAVYGGFDQVAAAGGSGVALVRSAIVSVADGALDITFADRVENPAVKAIEVLAGPGSE